MINRYNIQFRSDGALQVDKDIAKIGTTSKGTTAAMHGLKTAFVALAGAYVGIQGMRKAIDVIKEFDTTMLEVKAVTKASAAEFDLMSAAARRMGAETRFSASESGQALLALAKIGFDTNDAIAALPTTLNLAIAGMLGIEQAAETMAITLKQFGLGIDQSTRVADVLVVAANASATSVAGMSAAFANVGPVAKSAGLDFETTAAAIEILTNSGLDASNAGTSLKNILLGLAAPTEASVKALESMGLTLDDISLQTNTLEQIFAKLKAAGITLKEGEMMFGRLGVTGALALADMNTEIAKFTEENKNAAGAAKDTADVMDSGLNASFLKLKSVTEELMLSLGDAGFTKVLSSVINGLTWAVSWADKLVDGINDILSPIDKSILRFEELALSVKVLGEKTNRTTFEQEEYRKAINALSQEYPEYLKNLNAEKTSYENISNALIRQRDLIIQNIAIQKQKDVLTDLASQRIELSKEQLKLERSIERISAQSGQRMVHERLAEASSVRDVIAALTSKEEKWQSIHFKEKQIASIQKELNELDNEAIKITNEYAEAMKMLMSGHEEVLKSTDAQTESVENQIEAYKKLSAYTGTFGALTPTEIISTDSLIPAEVLDNTTDQIETWAEENADIMEAFSSSVSSSLSDMFMNVGDGFAGFMDNITSQIIRLMTNQMVNNFFGMIGGMFSGGPSVTTVAGFGATGGGMLGMGSGSGGFAGVLDGFAFGGEYNARTPRIVGEYGPEIDIPSVNGRVLSRNDAMNAMGGGSQPLNVKILNQVDENMILQALQTKTGERLIMNVISKNSNLIPR